MGDSYKAGKLSAKKILIVEDDRSLRDELSVLLKNAGYETILVEDFQNVSAQMEKTNADLVLLDINLPVQDGETILRDLRKKSDIPVIMLTSRTNEIDEILSMGYGADDFITKPFRATILLLRISAVLKRSSKNSSKQMYHNAEVCTTRGTLSLEGRELVLTKNEMIIFQTLLDRIGEIVTRDELMTALWDKQEFVGDNTLSVNISRLRGKLSELGFEDAIETRKKLGYVLK
ncbi:MAG: response regulator transcription factor [Treponema sp.]|nr:response regulator transcription factor [Treponema sp.]